MYQHNLFIQATTDGHLDFFFPKGSDSLSILLKHSFVQISKGIYVGYIPIIEFNYMCTLTVARYCQIAPLQKRTCVKSYHQLDVKDD